MAYSTGQPTTPLIDDLLARGHEFSFPQVMRIARLHLATGTAGELPELPGQDRLRVRPDLSLAFPAADVARVEHTGPNDDELLITTTFLGLYGSSSPLPTHYTEDLLDESSADGTVSRDFLDILHQRLYQLYFHCWSKYRLFVRVAEERNPADRDRLFCLIGLGERELRNTLPDPWSLVRYAGLLTQFPRSADGLQTLLRDALGERRIRVEQCVLRRVPIPGDQQMRMGMTGIALGVSTVLGSEIADRMGKFRLLAGPLKLADFNTLLPGSSRHDKLAGLIRLYILDPLDYDLRVTLAAGEARPISLGGLNRARLGWNSWCFSGDTLGEVSTLFPIAAPAAQAPDLAAEDFGYTAERTEPTALIDYYRQELSKLRDLAASYATRHPELSAMISGHLADPGVERLFEGVAFLNANLRQKLDDDFPEIIHDVIDSIQPNYLRPIPATTIIAFTPKQNCTSTQLIPVGTELKSVPVDGTACTFTTRYPVEIHPSSIANVVFAQPSGKPAAITLSLKLTSIALSSWKLKSLRFFLAGESSQAADLYLVLMRYVKKIVIAPLQDGESVTLDATHLKAVGFEDSDTLFPGSVSGAASPQLLQEYFIQPDKFMFIDLLGWEKWSGRGEGSEFEIRFELDKIPFDLHRVSSADFALFATPAVNVFKHRAEPITIDPLKTEYTIRPAENHFSCYDIYSVTAVTGLLNNSNRKISITSSGMECQQSLRLPTYTLKRRKAALRDGIDTVATVDGTRNVHPNTITSIAVELACTNSQLPEKLRIGDVCEDTDSSPSFAEAKNCTHISRYACITMKKNLFWRLYSHQSTNISLLTVGGVREMLDLLVQACMNDYASARQHRSQIQGIQDIQIKEVDRLHGRLMHRGWEFHIKLNVDHYKCQGDLYLFGACLDDLMRWFATESSFTRTIIDSGHGGIRYEWPAKRGRRALV